VKNKKHLRELLIQEHGEEGVTKLDEEIQKLHELYNKVKPDKKFPHPSV